MSYRLIWVERAYDDLADIWVAVDVFTRRRIEAAITYLNAELQRDPWQVGESRSIVSRRMSFVGPIGVVFRIEDTTRTVRVNHIWRYGK